jgi:hypothetical protein
VVNGTRIQLNTNLKEEKKATRCKGTLVGVGDGLDEEQEQDERHRRQELDAGRRPTSQLVCRIKIEIIINYYLLLL